MIKYTEFTDFKGVAAKVRWFDNMSGEGFVRLGDGSCVYLHYSAIEGAGRNVWVTFPNSGHGIECEVELIEDTTFRQISRLRSPHVIIEPRVTPEYSRKHALKGDYGLKEQADAEDVELMHKQAIRGDK